MKVFFIFVGICISCVSAAKWVEGDTVVVDATESKIKEKRDVLLGDAVIRTAECKTTRGKVGQCKELNECYPMLFPVDKNVTLPQGTLNDGLASILIDISGFCDSPKTHTPETFNQVAKSEILICCADSESPDQALPAEPESNDNDTTDTPVAVEDLVETKLKPQQQRNCGSVKVNLAPATKVVGGREALRGEFPWIVALLSKGRQFCGGSLINANWVVTAAHCVQHMGASDVQNLRVYLGSHNIYQQESTRQISRASRVLYHKAFSMQHLHHDVALIKLTTPVTYTDYVQSVCIHEGGIIDGLQADVAGWGQLQDNGPQPQTLRTASVQIWSNADCSDRYGSQSPAGIGDGMVCSGGSGEDSCRGDSGGPLTINSREDVRLVGIVSWGIGCGTYPGVYTRASRYLDWIQRTQNLP